jgi:16S rRNA (uracil1498-N3)-methyltransferase
MSRVLRVPLEALAPGERQLAGAVARYILRVHRRSVGDRLACFDPELGLEADAEIVRVAADRLECRFDNVRPSGYCAHPICLLQGLAKGHKPDATLAEATALGVESIIFVDSERTVVRLEAERGAARRERWQRIAAEAARQSGRGNVPSIEGPFPFETALGRLTAPRRLLLSPRGTPLLRLLADWRDEQRVALLVGPEGGFSRGEIERTAEFGFLEASLGPTTLRSELAGVAALGALVAFRALSGIG